MADIRTVIAKALRNLADNVDRSTGPRAFPGYWNHTAGGAKVTMTDAIQVHPEVPGCPLWYMAEDYERSWQGTPNA
ncbi:hypothetical protein [Nocardia wallacei]|uniref:hypothetical protein n=1 Tax=Nocardia wallacei TaxID=480035 RepID=UPI002455E8F9|nr:hypothetical protein [Nocardia wallacei]